MKIHNKLIKSTKVAEKTDSRGDFIITILTRTGLHTLPTVNPGRRGGDSHMERTGMLVGNFEFNP